MFCPKCGTEINEGEKICSSCGVNIEEYGKVENNNVTPTANIHATGVNTTQTVANPIKIVYWGLAAIVLIMCFIGAHSIVGGGNEIMEIQSVGGRTLEEAYYQELGKVYSGIAMAIRGLGIFAAAILVKLGMDD
ncbi:MAG: zinc-ribbon domain-containing protein [Methanosphaera stadtmanae]|nr:zinc-ribbon domain-containing protein [Methanosphaera stadtmanae]